MSGGVVCYIERTHGGSGIKRIRLIAAGLARQWTAPDASSVSSVGAGEAAPAALGVARAGATWIAETLNQVGLKRLAAICVDAEGSICAWLSAPSPEPSVVRATIVQSGADGDGGASGAGVGAARLITESTPGGSSGGGLMGDTSVQALATLDPEAPRSGLNLTPWRKKSEPAVIQRKQRYAVLAVQDAIARVLLDELDAHGIETERVVTLWHAMAGAWDRVEAASLSDRLVAANSPGAAVILVEPTGRLIWAWTRSGELVAGGAMRLATRARNDTPAQNGKVEALAAPDAAARREITNDETENLAIDFTPADAGRLAVDWLSWSAQLGHCPDRVVCLSVPGLGGGGGGAGATGKLGGDSGGPEALFANLTRVWPGATVDGAVHEDPIGATIARLAGLGPEVRVSMDGAKVETPAAERPYHHRPREAMSELSSRPGRADRRLYQWIGIALCGAAFLVGAVGWQFHRSMGAANEEYEAAVKARKDALAAASAYGVTTGPNPLNELQNALKKMQEQNKTIKPPKPILRELIRVLAALNDVNIAPPVASAGAPGTGDDETPGEKPAGAEDETPAAPGPDGAIPPSIPGTTPGGPIPGAPVPGMPAAGPTHLVLNEILINSFAATAKFVVPDASTGPTILEKVQAREGVLQWSGSTGMSVGTGRTYTLTGLWLEDAKPGSFSAPPTSASPATPPPPAPSTPAQGAKPLVPPHSGPDAHPATPTPAPGVNPNSAPSAPKSSGPVPAPGPTSTAPAKPGAAAIPAGSNPSTPPATIGHDARTPKKP